MPQYLPQLTYELGPVIIAATHAIAKRVVDINDARLIGKSGSDVVVEEDLANAFGRITITKELERSFKGGVHIHKVTPISTNSEVELQIGTGPTMTRAFQPGNDKYFATFVTLSLLSYFTGRESLAQAISVTLRKRLELQKLDATLDPGYEGIMGTIRSCNTQSSTFDWSMYAQAVEQKIEHFIPNYRHSQDYVRLTPALLLGAVDFLYESQRLPQDRKVSVSNQMGCIVLIIWAHYIMGLSVAITGLQNGPIIFGNADDLQVFIAWVREMDDSMQGTDFCWHSGGWREDLTIRLHEGDPEKLVDLMVVAPDVDEKLRLEVEERHPLEGYGTTYLRRILNRDYLTSDTDRIYEESFKMIMALAIHASRRMRRFSRFSHGGSDQASTTETSGDHSIILEVFNVKSSANVLFSGIFIDLDEKGMDTYFDTLRDAAFDDYEKSLPRAFSAFFKRFGMTQKQTYNFVRQLKHLAKLVLLFAHVKQVDKCRAMPLVLHEDHGGFSAFMRDVCKDANAYGWVRPESIFHGIIELLCPAVNCSTDVGRPDADAGKKNLYLCSDFGWSVFFDTVQISLGKDPADLRPELINVMPGTPVNTRTKEWKYRIRDGIGFASNTLGGGDPQVQKGLTYVPRSIATASTNKEYWTVQSQEFELSLYIHVEPTAEWRQFPRVGNFQELLGYRMMQDMLWHTFTTEDCEHAATAADQPRVEPKECKLGPDVAALVGFVEPPPYDDDECIAERILIYLTKGVPYLRWLAIREAVSGREAYSEDSRDVLLRGKYCCDDCALEQVASRPGRWALIL